ncbi:MAG: sulfatase [Myxococcota bacterium]|nr:sulfatase [Myxococcota bacterium]
MGRVAAWLAACLVMGSGCGAAPQPRLVLLITVDTLRAAELGAYGSTRGLTPNLDALARDASVFGLAYAPSSFTLPSVAGLLTGRYPEELGIRNNESGLPDGVPTLATELGARGWQTAAVVGNWVLRRESGVARGFDRFDDRFPDREAVRHWPERGAAATTEVAIELVEGCTAVPGARCFVWAHYQDPHGPYDPPPGSREMLLAEERRAEDGSRSLPVGPDHQGEGAIPRYQFMDDRREVAWYRAGYRAEVGYVDEQVGRLLNAVEATGLADRAVVVFTADHGESLGEHGVWFAHGSRLTDEQVRVPLLVRIPGREPVLREDPVSLVDLMPSLLSLAGEGAAFPGGPGRDLFASGAEAAGSTPYFATLAADDDERVGILSQGFKFVAVERNGTYTGRLYAVGEEETDLSAAAPQVAAALRAQLGALREGLVRVPETRPVLDEEGRERLRQLGYLED